MSSDDESICSVDNEVGIIPDVEGENADQPIETIEVQEENTETTENKNSDDEDKSERKVVKPKRVIKNPQPKFNEQTLKTPKGLPAIAGHFKRVKFKGKGHEEKDLNVLMKTYEYWCHRLFPKYPFDASIARLETLGTKRATVTQLKILRAGLDLEEDKKLASDEEDVPATDGFVDNFGIEDQFDQLLPQTEVAREPEISDEQLERMRQNRIRAETLRKHRMAKANITDSPNISSGNSQNAISQSIAPMMNDTNITEASQESGQNEETETNEMDVQESEEVDFDSILNIVNEDNPTSSRNSESCSKTPVSVNNVSQSSQVSKRSKIIDSDDEMGSTQNMGSPISQTNVDSDENQTKAKKKKHNIIESDEEHSDSDKRQNDLENFHSDQEISSDGSLVIGSKNKQKIAIDSDPEEINIHENTKKSTNNEALSKSDVESDE